ncbi:MAG TPA: serine hydrolase domain-containing protein, partial [Chitinophagaceae bacterium]|nr:serine hydrolase domain-containing protein [Chitinophagaceae bacterium]
ITEPGRKAYVHSCGWSNASVQRLADSNTLYHIGSISKMFTAVMIFQLFQEKKLHPDTLLSHYFPQIKNSNKIRIAQLLNHHSGIHNFTNDADYSTYMEKEHSRDDLLKRFSEMPSDFEPGSRGEYSNTNYILLGWILEETEACTYAQSLKRRICDPLHLKHTRVAGWIDSLSNEAYSYTWRSGNWQPAPQTHPSIPQGAGCIESTPTELCVFIRALFEGKLVSPASLEKMKSIEDHYGSGILQFPYEGKKAYGHNGGIDGFQGMLIYMPDDSLAFALCGNAWNYSMNNAAIAILNAWHGQDFLEPDYSQPKPVVSKSDTPEGSYTNATVGLSIVIRKEGEQYTAQASGQSAFPLTKKNEEEYVFEAAGIRILFPGAAKKDYSTFRLLQGGMDLEFSRE